MDFFTIGIICFIGMIGLIVLGVPVAFAILLAAVIGNTTLFGFDNTASQLFSSFFGQGSEFVFASIPLFIFMGYLVGVGGVGRDLYDCVHKWIGRTPGGLAATAVVSCATFGAVVGVSAAAVATVGTITLPEMKRYGYNMRLATGSIASASTIAILMPPSLLMVLYGLWTETSIGQLFIAGIVPALLMTLLFCSYIWVRCKIDPSLGPPGPVFSWGERIASLRNLAPVAAVFLIVIGGIYFGLFTPSEAAGVGAFAVLVTLLLMRRLTWALLIEAAEQTARLSIMIFTVFISVSLFTKFLVVTDVTSSLVEMITGTGYNRYVILLLIILMYVVLGMLMDGISMLLLTLPLVFPVVKSLGFDPVWFGVLITILVEVGLITPPVGFNCYILRTIATDVPLAEIFRGIVPFFYLLVLEIALLIVFPQIATWLPGLMF